MSWITKPSNSISVTSARALRFALVFTVALQRSLAAQHEMSHASGDAPAAPLGLPLSRLASGTAWVPDASPMYALHRQAGGWTAMLHGAAFGQYDAQGTLHGDRQLGLIDWEMLMALRPLAGGLLRVDAMTSMQPFVTGGAGYPELLQTGGSFEHARLVNRQHPHDLIAELATAFDRPIGRGVAASLYVAAVGEPALGPVAYMHRPSAANDPFAPIGHHWEDAAHESDGVVTLGVYTPRVKLEGSVFNGRESDDYRFNIDYGGAALDSYSARVTAAVTSGATVSAWAGYLFAHDRLDDPTGMQRYGVSLLTVHDRADGRVWANGVIWGMNIHHHSARLHSHQAGAKMYTASAAALVESSFDLDARTTLYGRIEQVQKSADDLGFLGGEPMQLFTVRSLSLGAVRDVRRVAGLSIGVGARGSVNLVPPTLSPTYRTRTPSGVSAYLRVRPARMRP